MTCQICRHAEGDHFLPLVSEGWKQDQWAKEAQCFHFDGEFYCECNDYAG
jgi:hypothetical protein